MKKSKLYPFKMFRHIFGSLAVRYFEPEVSRKIDKVMETFHAGKFLAHPIAAGEIEFDLATS